MAAAVADIGFTVSDSRREVETTLERLAAFVEAAPLLEGRKPVALPGERVALMLPYDGSTWLNIAIVSIWLVGNHVAVKFSSKTQEVARLTADIYRPIFGEEVRFEFVPGPTFLTWALSSPEVPAIVVFGSDRHILPYEARVRRAGKKLVFEGPGNDPFIVLEGADVGRAVTSLVEAKFMYSGQTCTAPERVFVHEPLYAEFLEALVERVKALRVGDPSDPDARVVPLASSVAVQNIKRQLADAVQKGGRIVVGGKVEGSLVHPTVVADANGSMLGMREEIFGPVAFVAAFTRPEEAAAAARDSRYGLRAEVWGDPDLAAEVAESLRGADYMEEVESYQFGKFGTVGVNEPRSLTWRRAFVTKPVGGYGYSGWSWETRDGEFVLRQGPKLLSLETSTEG